MYTCTVHVIVAAYFTELKYFCELWDIHVYFNIFLRLILAILFFGKTMGYYFKTIFMGYNFRELWDVFQYLKINFGQRTIISGYNFRELWDI